MKTEKQLIEDIIYEVATGSINGLPAIPERRFKKLIEAIISHYANANKEETK